MIVSRKCISTSIEVLIMMLGAIGAGGMATQTATSLDTDSNISSKLGGAGSSTWRLMSL